jgi:hypothetical protein
MGSRSIVKTLTIYNHTIDITIGMQNPWFAPMNVLPNQQQTAQYDTQLVLTFKTADGTVVGQTSFGDIGRTQLLSTGSSLAVTPKFNVSPGGVVDIGVTYSGPLSTASAPASASPMLAAIARAPVSLRTQLSTGPYIPTTVVNATSDLTVHILLSTAGRTSSYELSPGVASTINVSPDMTLTFLNPDSTVAATVPSFSALGSSVPIGSVGFGSPQWLSVTQGSMITGPGKFQPMFIFTGP